MHLLQGYDRQMLCDSVISSHGASVDLALQVLEGLDLIHMPHHHIINETLNRVFNGEIKRLIINIPPSYGKTLSFVWSFIARGFVINQSARFIHTSYSQELVLDNSAKVKEILMSEEFQYFNPITIRNDTRSKGLWRTDDGGGMRAVQTGGGITGFRAGHMTDGFSGAFVIDDPLKPDDARSRPKVKTFNERYNTTIASRLAHEDVPIILVMQRIASFGDNEELSKTGDMSEFLLRGGSGEPWHHLCIPVLIDNAVEYPKEYTHGLEIPHGLPDGVLSPRKHTLEDAERLKRANLYVFNAQYLQRPTVRDGKTIISGRWFGRYEKLPKLRRAIIVSDTANKTAARNDYSVFMFIGIDRHKNMYIIDLKRGKWEIVELIQVGYDFWNKHRRKHGDNNVGASRFFVEDKASGTQLIQTLARKIRHSIKGLGREKDKFTRVNGVISEISDGRVFLPANAPWVADFVQECEEFTDDDSHDFDDQVDCLCDGIEQLAFKRSLYDNL